MFKYYLQIALGDLPSRTGNYYYYYNTYESENTNTNYMCVRMIPTVVLSIRQMWAIKRNGHWIVYTLIEINYQMHEMKKRMVAKEKKDEKNSKMKINIRKVLNEWYF